MLPTRRMCLGDLNPHLLCVLCGGYFVDATTIIECLHSFCKTCIVKFLETSKYCPICDVQVHKTRPLQNIRSDQTLQDIVYKLVPGLFQNEMRLRREFYSQQKEAPPSSKEDAGEVTDTRYIYTADEPVSLSLQYSPSFEHKQLESEVGRRYLRCPAAVTVAHLQKLLRSKHGLSTDHRVDICHEADIEPLSNNFTLMDVAYIHQWKRKGPMNFHYQIYERPCKRRCVEDISKADDKSSEIPVLADSVRREVAKEEQSKSPALTSSKVATPPPAPPIAVAAVTELVTLEQDKEEEWKEVQLQISEAGIMKVTNLAVEAANETIISSGRVDNPSPSEQKEEEEKVDKSKSEASQQKSDINGNKKDIKKETVTKKETVSNPSTPPVPVSTVSSILPAVNTHETVTIAKKQPEIKELKTVSTPISAPPVKPKEEVEKTVVKEKKKESPQEVIKSIPASSTVKKSTSTSVGYKTLKTPPKSWNPSVSRGSYLSSHISLSKAANIAPKPESVSTDTSRPTNISVQNKAPRFFKERDRPRFLGNPLSGVKPMYQIQSDRPASSSSMIKIDPKTLSPMSSKPVVTTHNNHHISCNSITTGTGTITTTVASKRSSMPSMKPSMPPILHPPPNPMLYNYTSLMNSPLIRAPIISPNSPHPFPPYPMPQSMFYGSQPTPRFQPSPPTVQRVPANVHSQKSPTSPSTVSNELQQSAPKSEATKVNGETGEKINSKSVEISKTFTPELAKPSKVSDSIMNNNNINNNNSNTCETSTSSLPIAPKVQAEEPVPPQASK